MTKMEVAHNWVQDNIFNRKKGDGIAYAVFYLLIPILITGISLAFLSSDQTSIIYFYVTILVSACNCIYDAANRWKNGIKCIWNLKLSLVYIFCTVVAAYCFFEILYILIAKNTNCRFDYILLIYLGVMVATLPDVVGCFGNEIGLKACIEDLG